MSEPKSGHMDNVEGAIAELMSGMSALHMEPEAIPDINGNGWLSDTDHWVHHSIEHFDKALDLLIANRKSTRRCAVLNSL